MSTPVDNNEVLSPNAQVTITGRNAEVLEHFADCVKAKLAKIERLDPTLTSFHVELQHKPNPRRADRPGRIQITATGKGHLARAGVKEDSFYAVLESALGKMERSLRKVKVRRKISRSDHHAPMSAGEATASLVAEAEAAAPEKADPYKDLVEDVIPSQVVRTKQRSATPMTMEDTLSEMKLVGHDFYLFVNEATSRPSVVYHRHAYDCGLIELAEEDERQVFTRKSTQYRAELSIGK